MRQQDKERFMRVALDLAAKAEGQTSPNPMVGAVIVKDGEIVGQGYHRCAGQPHAEVQALRSLKITPKGLQMFVTLEPCCCVGRTGPCTTEIINAGLSKVYIACIDPNPSVQGKGVKILRDHGIDVEVGILETQARRLNECFFKWITTRRPFVLVKCAISMDGKLATRTGDSQWISGEKAREFAHSLRAKHDAVLVGAATVHKDDPQLTCRIEGYQGKQPHRVILDPDATVNLESNIFNRTRQERVVWCIAKNVRWKLPSRKLPGHVDILGLKIDENGLDLAGLLDYLGNQEITSLLVEGGGMTITSFLEQRLFDKVSIVIAPILIGGEKAVSLFSGKGVEGLKDAIKLRDCEYQILGDNIIVIGYP